MKKTTKASDPGCVVGGGAPAGYAEELAESNREIKAFAEMVAHDFRAPMINLQGFSRELGFSLVRLSELVDGLKANASPAVKAELTALTSEDIPEALKIIDTSVGRLGRMVSAMLEAVRLGRREFVAEELDLGEVVDDLLGSLSHDIDRLGVEIRVSPLPRIRADRLAMEQIIGNLLDNALKFLDNERPGQIGIDCRVSGGEFILTIRDNGRGIDPEDIGNIFNLFWRGSHQGVAGDGMGLAFVASLVRRLGGLIRCQSEPGEGTEMIVTLPKEPLQ